MLALIKTDGRLSAHLLIIPAVRSEARPGREVLLDTAVDSRREVELHMEPLLRVALLGGVLVQHHHDLGDVVQLTDQTDVLHGAAPLFVLALGQSGVTPGVPVSTIAGSLIP